MPNLNNIFGIQQNDFNSLNNKIDEESKGREIVDSNLNNRIIKESDKRLSIDKELNLKLDKNIDKRKEDNKILLKKINDLKNRINKLIPSDNQNKLENGFIIKEDNIWYQVKNKFNIEPIGITRSLPPTKIMLKYNKCEIFYNIIRDTDKISSCYYYNGYYYTPENRRMLRYSPSGIVTMDYIVCRVTITGEYKENNLQLKIEI